MNYTEFLKKLGETALAYAENSEAKVDMAPADTSVGISGDVTKEVVFDGNGVWSYSLSQYCPVNVDVVASVQNAPSGASFKVIIDTNHPGHMEFDDIQPNQEIKATIKTNVFSSTSISITVKSNMPNIKAAFKLHYSV